MLATFDATAIAARLETAAGVLNKHVGGRDPDVSVQVLRDDELVLVGLTISITEELSGQNRTVVVTLQPHDDFSERFDLIDLNGNPVMHCSLKLQGYSSLQLGYLTSAWIMSRAYRSL